MLRLRTLFVASIVSAPLLLAVGCYGRAGDTCRTNGDCRHDFICCNANTASMKAGTCEKSCGIVVVDSGIGDGATDATTGADATTDAATDATTDSATDASDDAATDASDDAATDGSSDASNDV